MPTAWRIVKSRHDEHAFDGEGSRRFGGRWNSTGHRTVYAAQSISLAALELLVHLGDRQALNGYSVHAIHFADRHVATVRPDSLPDDWRKYPAPHALHLVGNAWLAGRTTAVLAVPSAVIPLELNYLVNPEHPDFASLTTEGPLDFTFDTRLTRVRRPPRHPRS